MMESLVPIAAAVMEFLWESSWRFFPLVGMALLVERIFFRELPLFRHYVWWMVLLIPFFPSVALSSVVARITPTGFPMIFHLADKITPFMESVFIGRSYLPVSKIIKESDFQDYSIIFSWLFISDRPRGVFSQGRFEYFPRQSVFACLCPGSSTGYT
jgi:hypothetical protein